MKIPREFKNLRMHPEQLKYALSLKRFNVVPAGRRSGKTWIATLFRLIRRALSETHWPDARFFASAPTRQQAKEIFWDNLKRYIPKNLRSGPPKETDLYVPLFNGARIYVLGMDRPQRVEGRPWNGGIVDEYGNMASEVWTEVLRPAMTDRLGWVDFIGVPEGRNHYYDLAMESQTPEMAEEWAYWHWTTEEVLPLYLGVELAQKEIEAAKRDLDPLSFDQEYRGSFVTFSGRAYYCFDMIKHASKPISHLYNSDWDLVFAFDFNVSPGVAVVCQEIGGITHVIGEVYIPQNSTTPAVCRRLIQDWGKHKGRVICYGDATGGAKGSAKVQGSDWELIEEALKPVYKTRLRFDVPRSNPKERARINALNSRLESLRGDIKVLIDPTKAKYTARDLDNTVLLKGGSGEIDKRGDSSVSHSSDALGYYVERKFPVGGGRGIVIRQ